MPMKIGALGVKHECYWVYPLLEIGENKMNNAAVSAAYAAESAALAAAKSGAHAADYAADAARASEDANWVKKYEEMTGE